MTPLPADRGASLIERALDRFVTGPRLSWSGHLLTALALSALFLAVRVVIGPLMGPVVGFSLLIPAVLLAGLRGGTRLSLLTAAFCTIGMAIIMQLIAAPDARPPFWPPALSFWLVSTICGAVGSSLHRTLQRLQSTRSHLHGLMEEQVRFGAELQAMFEQASAGIVRTDLDGHILQANARFAGIMGHALPDLAGRKVSEFVHPDHREEIDTAQSHRSDRGGWQFETRYVRPDGEEAHVLASVRPLHGADERPYGYLSVVIDLTDTRRTEAALDETRHNFRVIADSVPILMWLTGPDRGGEFVNRAYLEFTGQQWAQVTPDDWTSFLHPDDRERIMRTFAAGLTTAKPFTMEARYRRHDGRWRWLKSFHQPRFDRDGRPTGMVGTAFDMTETREAAARVEESEARFRTVANSAPAMIWMADEQGRTVFGNRRFRSAFSGRTPARLITAWREMTHADDRDGMDRILADAQRHQRRFSMLNRINHPTFGERWIRTEAAPRHDSQGRLIGFTGVSLDVTDSQRAERDLKRINELLEERVSAALAEKARAEADLVRAHRLEAVGRLTGGVAHDFNNLLTVIMGGLDIMLRTDDPARREKMGQAALAAAKRGERLTGQLLAFSRRQPLSPAPTDLNALITEGAPLLDRAVGGEMMLAFNLQPGSAPTLVDPAKFEAALINLLVNARDASPRDGRIIVETAEYVVSASEPSQGAGPESLHPSELAPGRYVRVTVADSGEGMTEEVQRRVFEPFFTTKGIGKGTGLGLSQVYGFTRQSGGSIAIQSEPGRGTCIHLFLPWHPEHPAHEARSGDASVNLHPPGTPDRALRLLLVEDDEAVAQIATSLITQEGIVVERATNAGEALAMLDNGYDMVLSDILMPGGMSGIELAHRIAESHPQLRVSLTSGFPGEAEALRGTPWHFLPKPYTSAQLRVALGLEDAQK